MNMKKIVTVDLGDDGRNGIKWTEHKHKDGKNNNHQGHDDEEEEDEEASHGQRGQNVQCNQQ